MRGSQLSAGTSQTWGGEAYSSFQPHLLIRLWRRRRTLLRGAAGSPSRPVIRYETIRFADFSSLDNALFSASRSSSAATTPAASREPSQSRGTNNEGGGSNRSRSRSVTIDNILHRVRGQSGGGSRRSGAAGGSARQPQDPQDQQPQPQQPGVPQLIPGTSFSF